MLTADPTTPTTTIEIPTSVVEAIRAARAARDAGMQNAELADSSGWDRKVIDQAIDAYALTGERFSSNELRELLPEVRSALIGTRFMAASVGGRIRRVGLTPSTKKNTHGKDVAVWLGVPA